MKPLERAFKIVSESSAAGLCMKEVLVVWNVVEPILEELFCSPKEFLRFHYFFK